MPTDLMPAGRAGKPPREITGRWVLVALILFFGVVAAVNFTMMTLATRTFPGADARNGYDVSQAYNREIARARAQAERGWKADVALARSGEGVRLSFEVRDGAGMVVNGLVAEARLRHPSDRRQDRMLALKEVSPGVYRAEDASVRSGAWDVAVTATRDGEKVFATQSRVILKD